jgi:hypothetical protein
MKVIRLREFPVPLPDRMRRLAVDHRGFPVPQFVTWFKDGKPVRDGVGEPDFRVIDPAKIVRCIKNDLCWICGHKLGAYKGFAIGPMCAVNRTISEPPSHVTCARFAARCCPFLAQPRMKRNAHELPEHEQMPGFGLKRNPGVACVWVTKSYKLFRAGREGGSVDGVLFRLGEPDSVEWWAEGREATLDEVAASISSGLPSLCEIAEEEGMPALRELGLYMSRVLPLLPVSK